MEKETYTFNKAVKDEVASNKYTRENAITLLSGFVKVNGIISFSEQEKTLLLKTELSKVAKLIYNILKDYLLINTSFTYSRKMKLNKNTVYCFLIKDKIEEILTILELRKGMFSTFPDNLSVNTNLQYFIAGAFLASGSVSSPDAKNYHLQMIINDYDDAKYFLKLLNRYKDDNSMDFKILKGKRKYIIYLKKADQISTFLSIIGAEQCRYDYEDVRITKDFINSENRLNICIYANYQKTIEKAQKQIDDIKFIQKNNDIRLLNEKEQALCELRLANTDASLSTLSELLESEYKIKLSRSGVNRLFNMIHEYRLDLEKKLKQ